MEDDGYKAIIKAQELLAESGKLDIMARRKIWQAMGAFEEREEDSFVPRT